MRLLTTAAALACSLAAAAQADPITVTVWVYSYDYSQVYPVPPYPDPAPPDDPVIHVGDTIKWQRYGGTHDVHSAAHSSEQFASPILTGGSPTYSHTYTHEGRFYYYCTFHGFDIGDGTTGGMSGYIDVIAAPPPPPPCTPDFGKTGGVPGQDGILDNNDFIVFINRFFAASPAADLGMAGGLPGADGHLDNNDFIAFINLFFAGCP